MMTETEREEIIKEMMDKSTSDFYQSSYCGPNCRHCNRNPSRLRRLRWGIEDFFDWVARLFFHEVTESIVLGEIFETSD